MAKPITCAGLLLIAANVTNTANAEIDRIAPIKWLMELKYSLLSVDEICGSRVGFFEFMCASISHKYRLNY